MAKQQFYIPICVDNLAQFFAFGFITPSCVFPFSHYLPDALSLQSQKIPLYKKPNAKLKIPRDGLLASQREDVNLKSTVVIVSIEEPTLVKPEATQSLYLTDIIPIYCISEIIFENEKALEDFEYLTRKTGRVSEELLKTIKYKTKGFNDLFQTTVSNDLPIASSLDDDDETLTFDIKSLYKMSAYGAALALSYVMAKNGEVANDSFKALARLVGLESQPIVTLAISYLLHNFDEDQLKRRIKNEFFDVLIGCNVQERVCDKLIPLFDMDFGDEKVSTFFQKLKVDISDILKGKIKQTKSEQMERFDKVERVSQFIDQVVTVFAHLHDTEKLFTQPISTMNDEGYINLAIAYGFRDKFYELPKSVRQIKGLECFIIECMYRYHKKITTQEVMSKPIFKILPTFTDIINDPETPELRRILSKKLGLVSKNLQQSVIVSGYHYVPENIAKMVEIWPSTSKEFTQKMIMNKAFEDINFNIVLDVYAQEKSLTKERKKLDKCLKSL